VVSNGIINTVAGNGRVGNGGDGGPTTKAQLMSPAAVGVRASGEFLIVDSGSVCHSFTPSRASCSDGLDDSIQLP
jgi:hypothetical protein